MNFMDAALNFSIRVGTLRLRNHVSRIYLDQILAVLDQNRTRLCESVILEFL